MPWGETSFLTPDPKGERFRRGSLTRSRQGRGATGSSCSATMTIGEPSARSMDTYRIDDVGCWAQFRVDQDAGRRRPACRMSPTAARRVLGRVPSRYGRTAAPTVPARSSKPASTKCRSVRWVPTTVPGPGDANPAPARVHGAADAGRRPVAADPAVTVVIHHQLDDPVNIPHPKRETYPARDTGTTARPGGSPEDSGTRQDHADANPHLPSPGRFHCDNYLDALVNERTSFTETILSTCRTRRRPRNAMLTETEESTIKGSAIALRGARPEDRRGQPSARFGPQVCRRDRRHREAPGNRNPHRSP